MHRFVQLVQIVECVALLVSLAITSLLHQNPQNVHAHPLISDRIDPGTLPIVVLGLDLDGRGGGEESCSDKHLHSFLCFLL